MRKINYNKSHDFGQLIWPHLLHNRKKERQAQRGSLGLAAAARNELRRRHRCERSSALRTQTDRRPVKCAPELSLLSSLQC